jgi:hypothetical protein
MPSVTPAPRLLGPEDIPLKYLMADRSDPEHPFRVFNRKLSLALLNAEEDPSDKNIAKVREAMAARLRDFGHDYKNLNAHAEERIGIMLSLR